MSISVKNIIKLYGLQTALNNVSFEIKKGEIVGFLGPNGAGKSTMMKILTGYIPQNQGEAQVASINVAANALKVKAKVGYLPENNPLYTEMYVKEYLQFVAGSYGVSKKRADELIELTGITPEKHKKISQLSKGYRQRVGLAAALIHDPEVLILDEPTTGLDPNQLVEIRQLIKEVGKEKTVMLSTHIMQEVEQLCDRVIIINKGNIVADQPIEVLKKSAENKSIVISFENAIDQNKLRKIEGVVKVKALDDNRFELNSQNMLATKKGVTVLAASTQNAIVEIHETHSNLERIFQDLTQN